MKKTIIVLGVSVLMITLIWMIMREGDVVNHEKFFSKLQKQKFDLEVIKNNPERVIKTFIVISNPEAKIDPSTNNIKVDLQHAWRNYQLMNYIVGGLNHPIACLIVGKKEKNRVNFNNKSISFGEKSYNFSDKKVREFLLKKEGFKNIFETSGGVLAYYNMHALAYPNACDFFGAEDIKNSMNVALGSHRHAQWQAIRALYVRNDIISEHELKFNVSQFKKSLPQDTRRNNFIPDLELYKKGLKVIAGINDETRLSTIIDSVEWTFKRHCDVVILMTEKDLIYDLYQQTQDKPWRVIVFLKSKRELSKNTPNQKKALRMIQDIDEAIDYLKK